MGLRLVYEAPQRHVCPWLSSHVGEGWWVGKPGTKRVPDGSVAACEECSTTWVANTVEGCVPNVWHREGRFERWLRERRKPGT